MMRDFGAWLLSMLLLGASSVEAQTELVQVRQWAFETAASSEYGISDCMDGWCALDATGPPDTDACGDISTAWAPLDDGLEPEWLEVAFASPVYATAVEVYETFHTGFVTRIELIDVRGTAQVVWEGLDTTACPGVLEVEVPQTTALIDRVRVHTQIDGWEEIDTVKLVGTRDHLTTIEQWPFDATASASYGEGWAATQAEGRPNTPDCDDAGTAWAPLGGGSAPEWLEVYYLRPVHARKIVVYETYKAGSVYRVDLIDERGAHHTVWSGLDETPCPGRLELSFDLTPYRVVGARIHTQIFGWEEIDAVELIGLTPAGG